MSPLSARDCTEVRKILSGKGLGVRYRDLARFFRRADCRAPASNRGSHRVWVHPSGTRLQLKDDGSRELLPAYVKDALTKLATAEGCP